MIIILKEKWVKAKLADFQGLLLIPTEISSVFFNYLSVYFNNSFRVYEAKWLFMREKKTTKKNANQEIKIIRTIKFRKLGVAWSELWIYYIFWFWSSLDRQL